VKRFILMVASLAVLLGMGTSQGCSHLRGAVAGRSGAVLADNPPVYSGQEAAALLFGGAPSDYVISTLPQSVDATTWRGKRVGS